MSLNSKPEDLETVVSFNCRIETGEKIRVVLLAVDAQGKHFDFVDGTKAIPLDELQRVAIKARHHSEGHYRKEIKKLRGL
jgi:hypothetical protein